jgi:hypothetical protein
MPRPLKKRKPPKPSPVVIRRPDRPAEVVSASEMAWRREEAEWIRATEGISLDTWEKQRLLGLRTDATITIPTYTEEMLWFVLDVNGLADKITADTLIFDQPFERTFPFAMVEPRPLTHAEDSEAAAALCRLQQHRRHTEPHAHVA